jgi:hypothetical protein
MTMAHAVLPQLMRAREIQVARVATEAHLRLHARAVTLAAYM